MTSEEISALARRCGFELAGVAPAVPLDHASRFHQWTAAGFAGEMRYLTDHRARIRDDPRLLLPEARSMICVGMLYNTPLPYSIKFSDTERAWISRYAWGGDYHDAVRRGLEQLDSLVRANADAPYSSRICVDTAPLLERSYARAAGLGWIGHNGCLINQGAGSWFFLGELLTSLDLPPATPPPDRCGTCRRCIEACPTSAIVPFHGAYALDSRLCISYLTIELRGPIPEPLRASTGANVFGCDICQDVCPWNRRAPVTSAAEFAPRHYAPPLESLAEIGESEFRGMFRGTPVTRAKYHGFLRNVVVAMGASRSTKFRPALDRLAASPDALIAEHARWALDQLAKPEPPV